MLEDRERRQSVANKERSAIAHEHACRVEIEAEETNERARESRENQTEEDLAERDRIQEEDER